MIRGSCLCGGIKFEIDHITGPFELCHCSRCRKVTGSAFFAGVYVDRKDFRLTQGHDLIHRYEAPILRSPPPYRACFCGQCGSPIPDIFKESEQLEIPAGLFDEDLMIRPDRHIFVEVKAPWYEIKDSLPQLDRISLQSFRSGTRRKSDNEFLRRLIYSAGE